MQFIQSHAIIKKKVFTYASSICLITTTSLASRGAYPKTYFLVWMVDVKCSYSCISVA